MSLTRRALITLLGSSGLVGLSSRAAAQTPPAVSPGTSTTLIIAGPAGSRTGIAGRIIAAALGRQLGRPVEVVAAETPPQAYALLAAAEPDGRTLGLIGAELALLHWRQASPHNRESFTPLALLAEDPAGIHVRQDAPWKTIGDLKLGAGASAVRVAGAAQAAIWHMSTIRLAAAIGQGPAALPWLPLGSVAEAAEEVLHGGAEAVVCSIPEIRATPSARQVRTLAIMASRRNPRYPDVPAASEAGLNAQAAFWRGVVGPKGMPAPAIAQVTAALRRAHADAELQRELHKRGFARPWLDATAFAAFMAREDAAMQNSLKSAGLIPA